MDANTMKTMFSSATDQWATPQAFYDRLDAEFNFELDPCADDTNHKCERYFTAEQDGLSQQWAHYITFMNPPYQRGITEKWIKKAYEESEKGAVVVALLPSRTDTKFWHDYVMKADEIRFVRGRLKFGAGENSAPFPSAVVVFRKNERTSPKVSTI